MPSARPRPCCVCRKWFRPDPRVGDRQRACSASRCQRERHRRAQVAWVAANPDYFIARRLLERSAAAELHRRPAPLDRLPWDVAQDEFGRQGAEFLGEFGRLLVEAAQDEMGTQALDTS